MLGRISYCLLLTHCLTSIAWGQVPEGVKNSQNPNDKTIPPLASLSRIRVPKGFEVKLFAAEPNVAQPIAATFDDRGRLWVAECYSHPNWKPEGHDRILIFEDTDGDGQFDVRKVFWDQGRYLTGLVYGHGGVWICNTPSLMFIPDADGDDVPDGPPVEVLNGWTRKNHNNVLNNLIWGPDGWLYGCIGNSASSFVGPPGASDAQRTRISRGIWRYHPVHKTFEVVGEGAGKPWGLDFDRHGQGFFTNCVLGHLWHLVPGAYYVRRGVEKDNPIAYSRIAPISDHLHWGGGRWTSSRGGKGAHNVAGGGHAHTGAMIYLGDNWPAAYRNTFFTGNIHGNRTNNDTLHRHGSGYVAKHSKDFLRAHHDWFRCLWQKYGPDGGVLMGDWHDFGECHDSDGSHRTSGRIYKVTWGSPVKRAPFDLADKTDLELVQLQLHENEWYVRHARRLLQERAIAGKDLSAVHTRLRKIYEQTESITFQLRCLWALYVSEGLDEHFLREQLSHSSEHIRAWAVRLMTDRPAKPQQLKAIEQRAEGETSAFVRLHLASALNRLPATQRWRLADALTQFEQDDADHNLPHLIWYGIAPLWEVDKERYVKLLGRSKVSQVRLHMTRLAAGSKRFAAACLVATEQRPYRCASGCIAGNRDGRSRSQAKQNPGLE